MRNEPIKAGARVMREHASRNAAFYLFCAFLVSYFGRFARRVPLLGILHFDLVLAGAALVAILFVPRRTKSNRAEQERLDPVSRRLWVLLGYIVATVPFVEWPGSVLHNFETYAKSVSLFFFVVATIDTTRKLRTLLAVYAATQVWRVLEPLFMHVRSGYWGDYTSLGNWEYMDRLSGSPYDIINPNGLAFVVIMTLPLLHFLIRPDTTVRRIAWLAIAGAMCYALVLSASRSGFLAFVFLCLFVIWRSKYRVAWVAVAVLGATVAVALMTGLQRERYVSIFSHSAPGSVTAEGRIAGVIKDFEISLRRPLFGHGLGTSREANAHFRNEFKPSHNLYTETAEELGYIGLMLVLALIWSFLRACWTAQKMVRAGASDDERLRFLNRVADSLVVVVAVDLFFSFAGYGLSEPYWYFIGGLSVVTARIAATLSTGTTMPMEKRPVGRAVWPTRGKRRLGAPHSGGAPGLGAR
jgi:putative inorganic carbon (hco3(-)) transporter